MVDRAKVEADVKRAREIADRMEGDLLRLHESGISRDSEIYKAVEREVHRQSDEFIAAAEMHNALGTSAEESEARYQDLWRRSARLQEALVCLFDAGIAPGSPIHTLVEEEADRVHAELDSAGKEREASRSK